MPRLSPLTESDLTDEQRELLGGVKLDGPAGNIFGTLVRHPGLFRKWLPFGGKLLNGKLPPRERELLILRTAWNCGTDYEWGQHVGMAKGAGLTDDEIGRIPQGPDAGWDDFDATLLRAADEIHHDHRVSDTTWKALSERYDERQMVELPFLVGHYHMVGFVLNSLGVEREAGVPGFPDNSDA
jgi:alkylhydroperoxidase family enzyme